MDSTKYKITVHYSPDDTAWIVEFPDFPGCTTHGDTLTEALNHAGEALTLYLESLRDLKR